MFLRSPEQFAAALAIRRQVLKLKIAVLAMTAARSPKNTAAPLNSAINRASGGSTPAVVGIGRHFAEKERRLRLGACIQCGSIRSGHGSPERLCASNGLERRGVAGCKVTIRVRRSRR